MIQIKDSRTAGSAVNGLSSEDHHDNYDSGDQHANAMGHGEDNGWGLQYDDSQAMDHDGNLDALGKGKGFGKSSGKMGGVNLRPLQLSGKKRGVIPLPLFQLFGKRVW